MCGIFAWSGIKPGQFNKHKFDILGIWNETRGEHSCGVAADGNIKVGIKELKVYRDFAASGGVPKPVRIPSAIGHTRYATFGEHNSDNAHPFGFGTDKHGKFKFVGVHNGSLLNHTDLAEEFGIELTDTDEKTKVVRKKIDSEVLLEILYTTGDFKVLSKYNGAAALIWQFLEEPDTVYYYHGCSKLYSYVKEPTEERPLFYYIENKNSMYVSSIEDSLSAIGGNAKNIDFFDYNTVYKVKNGDVANAQKTRISRHTNFQKKYVRTVYNDVDDDIYAGYQYSPAIVNKMAERQRKKNLATATISVLPNIYKEEPAVNVNEYKGRVYFNKLRYHRNGHRINGIWTLVKGYGFYYLGENSSVAEKTFWSYTNKLFIDDGFHNPGDLTTKQIAKATIPFRHGGEFAEIVKPPLYVFFDGIMLEHHLDYAGCVSQEKRKQSFSLIALSTIAKHPIMDISYTYRQTADQRIYRNGVLYTGTCCPLESNRTYSVLRGDLVEMNDLIGAPKVVHNLMDDVAAELEQEMKIEADAIAAKALKSRTDKYITNDLLEEDITKIFSGAHENFTRHKDTLVKYGSNPRALQAISIINTFINGTYQLLSVEPKE